MRQLTRFCCRKAAIACCTCDGASIGAPEAIGSALAARAGLHKRPPAKGACLHSSAMAICTAAEFLLPCLILGVLQLWPVAVSRLFRSQSVDDIALPPCYLFSSPSLSTCICFLSEQEYSITFQHGSQTLDVALQHAPDQFIAGLTADGEDNDD